MTESPPIDEEGKNYAFGKKFKYTLDSDEEDDEVAAEKYNIMNDDALECIEKSTIDFDGDIKITPFNMDEELETGHFDKEGTYIFKKKNDDIRDNWLDNIDWNGVKPKKNDDEQPQKTNKEDSENSEDDDDLISDLKIKEYYRKIIELIEPGETIRKAIQRYGKQCNNNNNNKGQKRKFQSKDTKKDETEQKETLKKNELKEKMLKLISIADLILQTGDMDIYERTFEQFNLHLNKANNQQQQQLSKSVDGDDDDMFGDDFDVNKVSTAANPPSTLDNNSTQWEYKWEDSDDAKIYGPYSSEDMLAWVNQGYFDQGIFVRRTDSEDAKFYSSKRIDFELYI